jgi:hypothetical protein
MRAVQPKVLMSVIPTLTLVMSTGCLMPIEESKPQAKQNKKEDPPAKQTKKEPIRPDEPERKKTEPFNPEPPPKDNKKTKEKEPPGGKSSGDGKGSRENGGNPSGSESSGGTPGTPGGRTPGSGGDSGSTPPGSSNPPGLGGGGLPKAPRAESSKSPKSKDAKSARENARRLLADAEKAFSDGNAGVAYDKAAEAWEDVNPYAESDAECQKLAGAILARLKKFGDEANRKYGGRILTDKPLVTQ